MKKACLFLAIVLLVCSLQSCSDGSKVVKNNLQELIMSDDVLTPGEQLSWRMSREDFLNSPFATDALKAGSKEFDETRVGEMSNGMTDYTLETEIALKSYDVSMEMMVLFDENDELIRTTYRMLFPENEKGKYIELLNRLAEETDGIEGLTAENPDLRGFSEESLQDIPFFLTWHCAENNTSTQLQAMQLSDTLMIDFAVYVDESSYD